ncbi:sigma-70 family RNA polymerase sigma factor [Engelhardtia mirabilis]|uniref:ECF RNA polymerase sigma factor SigW n=1 Tax=Engelhardtia mirabilis TaxID=2528011 RepID=A0A518BPU1_9BACT|nr:ECF RNA polymerase sigma factor SigW [Planctomycetes bacterium Pla133]QDV03317.1 ECF RNA polymerase sigma factor SigW [Planctomycetes bacterium Pla86]
MESSALNKVLDDATLDEHGQRLQSLARALVGESAADDLVQRTWLEALRSRTFALLGQDDRGPYLRGIARRLAANERRQAARRGKREAGAARSEEIGGVGTDPGATTEQIELLEVVLKNLKDLPEPYRTTLRLRYLEQLPAKEIGERTGASEGAVRVRVHRGLGLLRERMDQSHRGNRSMWFLPLAKFAGADRIWAPAAAPGGLLPWLALGVVLLGIPGLLYFLGGDDQPLRSSAPITVAEPTGEAPSALGTPSASELDGRTAVAVAPVASAADSPLAVPVITVVSRPDGEPLAGARIQLRESDGIPNRPYDHDELTGADGRALFPLASSEVPRFEIEVTAPGFARVLGNVAPEVTLAGELTIDLWPLDEYSGRVLDSGGTPVVGAIVELRSRWSRSNRSRFVTGPELLTVRTDEFGHFELAGIADGPMPPRLTLMHPECGERVLDDLSRQPELRAALLAGQAELTLERANRSVQLRVVDPSGNPIAGASVAPPRLERKQPSWTATTDADGRLRAALGPGDLAQFTVAAEGYGTRNVLVHGDSDPAVDLQVILRPAEPLEGLVVDRHGEPIPGASVSVVGLPLGLPDGSLLPAIDSVESARALLDSEPADRGPEEILAGHAVAPEQATSAAWLYLDPVWTEQADEEGHFAWDRGSRGPVLLTVNAPGFGALSRWSVVGDDDLRVVLDPSGNFTLLVASAETGERPPEARWITHYGRYAAGGEVEHVGTFGSAVNPDGRVEVAIQYTCDVIDYSLVAEGHATFDSGWVPVDELRGRTLSIELAAHHADALTILTPGGEPAVGAEVSSSQPGAPLDLVDGALDPGGSGYFGRAAADGSIECPWPQVRSTLVAVHPDGIGIIEGDWRVWHELVLTPWSTVEIDLGPGAAGAEVALTTRRPDRSEDARTVLGTGDFAPSSLTFEYRITLDALGRGTVFRVPPLVLGLRAVSTRGELLEERVSLLPEAGKIFPVRSR